MRMSVMMQIRNVPDDLHRKLKARAALAGKSLSDYLLGELEKSAQRPTAEEFRVRLAALGPGPSDLDVVEAIRAEREGR